MAEDLSARVAELEAELTLARHETEMALEALADAHSGWRSTVSLLADTEARVIALDPDSAEADRMRAHAEVRALLDELSLQLP